MQSQNDKKDSNKDTKSADDLYQKAKEAARERNLERDRDAKMKEAAGEEEEKVKAATQLKLGKLNHYEILALPANADEKAIKAAFRKKRLSDHPDRRTGDREKVIAGVTFQFINEAFETLIDPVKRAEYDDNLKNPKPSNTQSSTQFKTAAAPAAKSSVQNARAAFYAKLAEEYNAVKNTRTFLELTKKLFYFLEPKAKAALENFAKPMAALNLENVESKLEELRLLQSMIKTGKDNLTDEYEAIRSAVPFLQDLLYEKLAALHADLATIKNALKQMIFIISESKKQEISLDEKEKLPAHKRSVRGVLWDAQYSHIDSIKRTNQSIDVVSKLKEELQKSARLKGVSLIGGHENPELLSAMIEKIKIELQTRLESYKQKNMLVAQQFKDEFLKGLIKLSEKIAADDKAIPNEKTIFGMVDELALRQKNNKKLDYFLQEFDQFNQLPEFKKAMVDLENLNKKVEAVKNAIAPHELAAGKVMVELIARVKKYIDKLKVEIIKKLELFSKDPEYSKDSKGEKARILFKAVKIKSEYLSEPMDFTMEKPEKLWLSWKGILKNTDNLPLDLKTLILKLEKISPLYVGFEDFYHDKPGSSLEKIQAFLITLVALEGDLKKPRTSAGEFFSPIKATGGEVLVEDLEKILKPYNSELEERRRVRASMLALDEKSQSATAAPAKKK